MATDSESPLMIGVLYPPGFDADVLVKRLSDAGRLIEVRVGSYQDDEEIRIMKRRGDDADQIRRAQPVVTDETLAALSAAEVLLALDVPIDVVELSPRLKWIQACGAGVRQFNEKALWQRGITLTTAAGVGADPIAEFVIGRLLEALRGFRAFNDLQQRRVWERVTGGAMLAGKTMGVLGLGAIGRAVAWRAKGLGMQVVATRRRFEPGMSAPDTDALFGPEGRDHVLEVADAVVLAVPETPDTLNFIGERELGLMKPSAVLCNVARGSVLDEAALVSALRAGTIAAAILDVQRQEPLPSDSPLWDAPNIYLSPHSATAAEGYFDRVLDVFTLNLLLYMKGEPLTNLVDPDAGY
jgi:phosphoglycerate dehydrogenase-like enzyme